MRDRMAKLLRTTTVPMAQISRKSGVSMSTLHKWKNFGVKNPWNITIEYVLRAVGEER